MSNAFEIINHGTVAGDGTGDGLFTNMGKIKGNFAKARRVVIGREITLAADNLAAADADCYLTGNSATDQTFTIPLATFSKGDVITIEQSGEGVIIIAVSDPLKQFIPPAFKTAGQYAVLQILCKDDTTNDEVFQIIGGAE